MSDFDQRQILANAVPLIAVILMASGIVVKTLPLESKRPGESNVAKIAHAGRQDIEARLWQDPFVAMRDVKGATPAERCEDAIRDVAHHPDTLVRSMRHVQGRLGEKVTVMPVFVPGGPYSQDAEFRRRIRYAVVMALLQDKWVPGDEEKLGFVWTFDNCVEEPWSRNLPELIPYEWFKKEANGKSLLVLWIDEDALTRRPLRGMTALTELILSGRAACPQAGDPDRHDRSKERRNAVVQRLKLEDVCRSLDNGGRTQAAPGPWERTVVLGPWTSTALFGLVRELGSKQADPAAAVCRDSVSPARQCSGVPSLRFYSSSATAPVDDHRFEDALTTCRSRQSPGSACEADAATVERKFKERVVRLNATDDQLTKALVRELRLRLEFATPFSPGQEALCDGTIVIVAEGDTSYARAFRDEFGLQLGKNVCGGEGGLRVEQVSYLRGLDGLAPGAGGAQDRAATTQRNQRPGAQEILLEQAAMERADGPSQYDYVRRLSQRLVNLDRSERKAGRHGIAAIGVLGNDAYDKILVLDALRDRFPKAVFFAADLDARLLDAGSVRSTRNLVVASGYGLSLQPALQGSAPPFRDTYQTGTFLSTLVALDPRASRLNTDDLAFWFKEPRRYEIGRTRPVNLIPRKRAAPATDACDSDCDSASPGSCGLIHADEDWRSFDPLPDRAIAGAILAMVLSGAGLAYMVSCWARILMRGAWSGATPAGVVALLLSLALLCVGLYVIHWNVGSPDGEPFAWFEGVSIWPTQIMGMVILVLTVALLVYGRWRLRRNIDEVAGSLGLATLARRGKANVSGRYRGSQRRADWVWCLDTDEAFGAADPETVADAWNEFVDRMRLRPSVVRIASATLLFLVFGIAVLALDWPYSPHRGVVAAWFNHGLQFVTIAAVMALLFAALDASAVSTRLLGRIQRAAPDRPGEGPVLQGGATEYPVSGEARAQWTRFQLAVQLASAVNRLVYLPFLVLLLLVPLRSRVFDTWDFSLPYAALLVISLVLAARCAMNLRGRAARLRTQVLAILDGEADRREIEAKLVAAGRKAVAAEGEPAPPALQAELLRRMSGEIRAVREGPFRPIAQEPVVRGILLVLGGTGGITTAEFLFLSRG